MNNRAGGEKVACCIVGAPDLSGDVCTMGYAP
jgi:hypothetical protein